MNSKFDSTLTWPRSQAPPHPFSTSCNPTHLFTANLAKIKEFVKKNDNQKAKKLVNLIQEFLQPNVLNFGSSKHIINPIQEEPQFESMNLTAENPNETEMNVLNDQNNGEVNTPVQKIEEEIEEIEELPEPFWVRCVPHLCLITLVVLYLVIGTFIYQLIDPAYGSKPFYTVLTMSYQVCFTIGWGNIPPLTNISRIFTVFYAAFGIPLTFAVVSNFGRFIAQGYGVKCLFLSNIFSSKKNQSIDERQHLALKDATCLLLIHHFAGVILFNTWYGKLGAINALYFVWVSSAMIGFGDIVPDPQNLTQAITMCIYFAIGNLFMQAFLLSICFHIHRAYFVTLKMKLFKMQNYFKQKFN